MITEITTIKEIDDKIKSLIEIIKLEIFETPCKEKFWYFDTAEKIKEIEKDCCGFSLSKELKTGNFDIINSIKNNIANFNYLRAVFIGYIEKNRKENLKVINPSDLFNLKKEIPKKMSTLNHDSDIILYKLSKLNIDIDDYQLINLLDYFKISRLDENYISLFPGGYSEIILIYSDEIIKYWSCCIINTMENSCFVNKTFPSIDYLDFFLEIIKDLLEILKLDKFKSLIENKFKENKEILGLIHFMRSFYISPYNFVNPVLIERRYKSDWSNYDITKLWSTNLREYLKK